MNDGWWRILVEGTLEGHSFFSLRKAISSLISSSLKPSIGSVTEGLMSDIFFSARSSSCSFNADQAQVLNRYAFEINLFISIKDLIQRRFGLLGVSRLIVSWPAKVSLRRA